MEIRKRGTHPLKPNAGDRVTVHYHVRFIFIIFHRERYLMERSLIQVGTEMNLSVLRSEWDK